VKRAFVLGAGFSVADQFPLIRGLRARVIHFLEAERHVAYRVFFEPGNGGFSRGQFYEGLHRVDPAESMEFEELLIALAERCQSSTGPDPCFITYRVLKTGCARLIWCIHNSIWRPSTPYQNFAAWLQRWLRVENSPLVVSFNWDLHLERVLTDAGIPWSYSLSTSGVSILKPHGSINWSGHLREGLRAEYNGWHPLGHGSKIAYDSNNPLSNPNMQEINSDLRYMIYPGDPDLPTSDEDVKWIWSQVEHGLSDAESLVFIGYSLPDYDTFASTFFPRFASVKAVEVYTPSDAHLERYRHLFGPSVDCHAIPFEHCQYAITAPT